MMIVRTLSREYLLVFSTAISRAYSFGKVAISLSAIVGCLVLLPTPSAIAQSSPGLVAAYGFSEGSGNTSADASGNSNTGALTNGAGWTGGKYGNAVSFDGSNDNVSIANAANLNLGSTGTIEAWVRLNAVNRWNSVLAKGTANNDSLHNYALEINNSNRFLCILGSGSASRNLTSTVTVAVGQFYHVACVWNRTTLQLYVNGALNASVAQNLTPAANSALVTIGQFGGPADNLAGVVDEVRIYNRALSTTEIQNDMNTPVGAPPPPPSDTTPPIISVAAPASSSTVAGLTTLYADASDNVG